MLLRPVLMPILRNPLQGIADGIRNMLAELLGSSQFFAPLTHSLVLSRGTGSPTFTRATTKTVENNDGYLVTLLSGEIGFPGARRVRNHLTKTEDLTNADWTKSNVTVTSGVSDPNGGTSAFTLTATAGNGEFYQYKTIAIGNTLCGSIYIRRRTGTGTVSFDVNTSATATITTSWTRIEKVAVQGGIYGYCYIKLATNGDAIDVWHPQLEDVTAQTTQAAGEYVSVGVTSAPYYHGSFVDGVKCFNTDLDGNPIAASINTGYIAEGARTNLILSSDDLTNGVYWSASGSGVAAPTVTVGQIDQAGTTKALKLDFPSVSVATNFSLFFTTSPVAVTATPHSNSWRLKGAVGGEQIYISGTPDGVTYLSQIVTLTDEWVDYELVGTPTAANWYWQLGVDLRDGGQSAKSAQTVYVCFPQLELGSFASAYIATTTAAVTRAADVDSVPTASNILAAASTVCLEFTPDHTPSGTIALWGTYVDASNYTAILHDATNMIMRKRIAGVNYDATIANAFTANTTYKVCGSWGASGVTVTLDGTEGTASANTTAAQIAATMQWGADGNSLQQPFATERNARVWQRQLSTSERGAITA